jgi:hypothetical protein
MFTNSLNKCWKTHCFVEEYPKSDRSSFVIRASSINDLTGALERATSRQGPQTNRRLVQRKKYEPAVRAAIIKSTPIRFRGLNLRSGARYLIRHARPRDERNCQCSKLGIDATRPTGYQPNLAIKLPRSSRRIAASPPRLFQTA